MSSPGKKRPFNFDLAQSTGGSTIPLVNGSKRRCTDESLNGGKPTPVTPRGTQKSILSYFTPKKPNDSREECELSKSTAQSTTPASSLARLQISLERSPTDETPKKHAQHTPNETSTRPKCASPLRPIPDQQLTSRPQREAPLSSVFSDQDPNHPHLSYKFLYPPDRLDIQNRAPNHPDYDEKTLYVPRSFLDSQTPALRQWWLIKQKNMDAILFFKMGKFYELFNEDAVIGVKFLDIMYMKGDESKPAHAGFPEVSYEKYAKMLIDKGFKVIRIEQTETPAMMEDRCARTGQRGKFDKVVQREVCRVTTKGTQMLGIMESVFHQSHNQYLMALYEASNRSDEGQNKSARTYGVCFVDVTTSKLYIGQFDDDSNLSKLNILLAHNKPTEVLFERNNLNQMAHKSILRTGAQLTCLKPTREFWPVKRAIGHLKTQYIFTDEPGPNEWPSLLRDLFKQGEGSENLITLEPKDEFKYGLLSFSAIVYYLQSQLILSQVLQCASFELYITPTEHHSTGISRNMTLCGERQLAPMIIDHIALRNLEIFENYNGSTSATLFDSLNYCKTHFGERLLKNWLCSPLRDIKQIENRQDAVEALVSNENASLMNEITHMLSQTPDLERLLSKIKSQCFKSQSDSKAIMFDGDQYSKAKISSFLNLLQNFKRIRKFILSVKATAKKCNSKVLRRLMSFTTEEGLFPDYSSTIDYFDSAFDHERAKKTGQIIPADGVDLTYDECQNNLSNIEASLRDYLEEQRNVLRCRQIEYFGTAKNRYQIQVPEAYCKNVPKEYTIETTRKGFKRYYTPTISKLFQKLTTYEEEKKQILDGYMSRIFEQFARKLKLWSAAIECVAILDVIQSMASFVRSLKANAIEICRPKFMKDSEGPLIEYSDGRHPVLVKMDSNYIPNDLVLDHRLVLLSGANMGGKSTLMRQTALLVVLAQMGCYVPASLMRLTPVDRIFSRLGASDQLFEGKSTSEIESEEASVMIRNATKNSLLLFDELGRGTSTHDGTAIAFAVITYISQNINCPCLFSTHYHTLIKDFEDEKNVRLAHMACKIERESDDSIDADPLNENITFLYKIAEGPVARSYGFNVAKLAGIDGEIIREAYLKAQETRKIAEINAGLQRQSECKA